jgi:2-methylcitrate dehydratase PrpD
MDYLDRLARLAESARFDALSASTLAATNAVVLDTLGAILAGSRLPENAKLAATAHERSGPRAATLIGSGAKAEPMLAALANATAGVALEVDEGNRWGGGHPAIHVLPAALAVAEELGADGPSFVQAFVAGYEVTSRIGGATRVRANVHSHGTWGTAGAAVAVARLRGYDAAGLRRVINLATSMSPANTWTPCFEGATIRNLYPGRAGLQGILAVHLHECGFTAVADAPSDVYGTLLADAFDPAAVVEGMRADDGVEVWRIERNYFKFHACCYYNHPALDAVHAIVRESGARADDIEHVTVTSIPFVARMAAPAPPAMLAAKFSIPYAVATALVRHDTFVDGFFDEARTDPAIAKLAGRVEVRTDAAMSVRSDGPTARVVVTLRDGRTLEKTTMVPRGDAANPASREARLAKVRTLAAPVIGATGVDRVVETVERLGELKDIRELTALVTTIR